MDKRLLTRSCKPLLLPQCQGLETAAEQAHDLAEEARRLAEARLQELEDAAAEARAELETALVQRAALQRELEQANEKVGYRRFRIGIAYRSAAGGGRRNRFCDSCCGRSG
jgi:hypothetical protein